MRHLRWMCVAALAGLVACQEASLPSFPEKPPRFAPADVRDRRTAMRSFMLRAAGPEPTDCGTGPLDALAACLTAEFALDRPFVAIATSDFDSMPRAVAPDLGFYSRGDGRVFTISATLPGPWRPVLFYDRRVPPSEALRVGGLVRPPVVVDAPPVTVDLPAGVSGLVIAETIIDFEGRVTHVTFLKRINADLDDPAERFLQSIRFKPATMFGRPVPVIWNVSIAAKNGRLELYKPPVLASKSH